MFDDGEKSAWKKIHAPGEILFAAEKKLTDSEKTHKGKRSGFVKVLEVSLSAAAVLVILVGIVVFSRRPDLNVYINGSTLLTDEETSLAIAAIAEADALPRIVSYTAQTEELCTAEFNIELGKKTKITVSEGTAEFFASDGTALFSGSEYVTDGSVLIIWRYCIPDEESQLVMTLADSKNEYEVILKHYPDEMMRTVKFIKKD